ncbi:MAG TPA: tetratricopeptide repeat protein [Casimicrobiaceae bacterium]|jgi:tetratricopeptide (TPR) repeat protein
MPSKRIALTPLAAAVALFTVGASALAQAPAAAPGAPAVAPTPTPATSPANAPAADASSAGVTAWPSADGMSAELFYRILLGNVALQRGDPTLAARAFFEAAKEARDADLARRAAEIALRTRQRDVAEAAASLWLDIDPSATRASQILAAARSGTFGADTQQGDIDALETRLREAIADAVANNKGASDIFLQLNRALDQQTDRLTTFRVVQDLAKPYPDIAEAQFALALAAANTGLTSDTMHATAMTAIDRALALKPDWDRAALLKSEIVGTTSRPAAIDYLKGFTRAYPQSKPAWGALAQFYVEDKQLAEARAIFARLAKENPQALEYQFGVAALSFQMKDWPRAQSEFEALHGAKYGENGVVELYLGQIAEEEKHYNEAIALYKAVPEGDRGWIAQLRIGVVMAKKGDLAGARRYLADLPAVTIEQRVEVRQTEAQILRDANDNNGAYAVLTKALVEHPDSPELLYDAAMVAEKLDKIDESEAKLARVVELKPDDAQALNALGYTLVDRAQRVDEGYALIERALKLAPDDAFILDSMGWALFRMGRLDDSITYLTRALNDRPDPEIAAHLGEVLWAKGEQARARDIWQSQLKSNPDNPLLLQTVRRFAP